MYESVITISIVGLITGFIFSMPVAGPISILITSKALKGYGRYCFLAAVGASIVDFLYCFIAVFSFTQIYTLYRPIINYIFFIGSIFLFGVGIKIVKTKMDLHQIEEEKVGAGKIKRNGGFWTGFMVNLFNPSLFVGWLISSFLVMSFVSSIGFNTGGLETVLDNNIKVMNSINQKQPAANSTQHKLSLVEKKPTLEKPEKNNMDNKSDTEKRLSSVFISIFYSFFVAFGTIIWFYLFSKLIIKHRLKLNITALNTIIRILGIFLLCFSLFLASRAIYYLAAKP